MSPVQEKLLNMLKWFHDYCQKHDLKYYIVGGSMLGAVRHGGFIPWDDDIDVVLPRPDYNRLLSLLDKQEDSFLLESVYSGNWDYLYSYAKLYDTSTTLVEKNRRNCKRGLYIDVFPLDGLGNDPAEVDSNFKKVDRLNMFLMTRTCAIRKERSAFKNMAIILARLIPSFIINDRKLAIKVDKLASSFGYEESVFVANLMGSYRQKEVMKKSFFGKPTEYKFENISVFGVEHYEEFLTHIYGNWRVLPPKEKRKTAHDYIEMNLTKSYLDKSVEESQ